MIFIVSGLVDLQMGMMETHLIIFITYLTTQVSEKSVDVANNLKSLDKKHLTFFFTINASRHPKTSFLCFVFSIIIKN